MKNEDYLNIIKLNCSGNELTNLPAEIGNLMNLQNLYCSYNKLTSLPVEFGNLMNLQKLYYYGNEIEYIPPNIQRLLNRQKTNQKVYSDSQNVHNHNIQEGIKKSINNLISIKPNINEKELLDLIIKDAVLSEQCKSSLIEYSNENSIHSLLNLTFKDILLAVYNQIELHEHKQEIKRVLNEEMKDATCKCFTGRISRLINCLNGFTDLVVIEIATNEQIGNIIILIKDKLVLENKYTEDLHKEMVAKELTERGYSSQVINEWIEFI